MKAGRLATAALISACAVASARADQQMLPTPYPQQYGPNALSIETPRTRYHQHLMNDAAPESYGPYAQGNPRTYHVRRRHQRLLRTPYPLSGS